jgi:microcystin-dependent protein
VIGQVLWLANTFCPRGTLAADGRLLAIGDYESVFSLLGTTSELLIS